MRAIKQRICIYPKDIQRITGKSERYSRNLLKLIMKSLHKEKHQFISIKEFCEFTGLDYDNVKEFIID